MRVTGIGLACLLLAGVPAVAGDSSLRGPVLGFVLDPRSHSIRPIQGIPGASTLGSSLDIPFAIDRAVFSGRRDSAAVFGGSGIFLVRGMQRERPEILPLPISIPDAASAVFNAPGSAALFYSPSGRQLQIVSGLAGDPIVGMAIDCSAQPGIIATAALDSTASSILVAMQDSEVGSVLLLRTDSGTPSPRVVLTSPLPATILYLNRDRDALVADSSSNQVVWIQDLNGSAAATVAAGAADGIASPVGMQLSADEMNLLVANAGTSSITVHSLAGTAPVTQLPLPVPPSRFDKLNGEPVLLVNDMANGPLYLLDEAGGRQVYFVPVN